METQTLQVEVREVGGKGPARQLRMNGRIPAVFYGPGVDTTKLTLSPKELTRALSTEMGRNIVLELEVGGEKRLAMVKDLQVHPVSRTPLHVDLYRVSTDREVEVNVPLRTRGRAAGVQKGGNLEVIYREVPVRATPDKIPAAIVVDVTSLELNEATTVEQLPLPEGVRVTMSPTRRVITVGEARVLAPEEGTAEAGEAAAVAPAAPGAQK